MISLSAKIIAAFPRGGFVMELMIVVITKTNQIKLVQQELVRLISFLVGMDGVFQHHGCVTGRMTVEMERMK